MRLAICFTLISLLSGCTGLPEQVTPVKPFNIARYEGKWFEIARLDHSFERGLSHVTAEYSLKPDGSVDVINSGIPAKTSERRQANGVAKFVRDTNEGFLKVSFFGPFYGSYVIFELDQEKYEYAFITGYNKDYLWLLARTPTVSSELKNQFVQTALKLGFNIDGLIWVDQSVN
ncbi:lipocalin family protein [uncultured Endozoicomonas sp.]|uniref:lipocalin family protein n=1 Tax=uncultured Endozoicomonas sp. TaxID=432652 RepID=UPI0026233683|nr:lipocalin family protein [uncultured Endozoicomonas sp.]